MKKSNNCKPDGGRRVLVIPIHSLDGVKQSTVQINYMRTLAQMIPQSLFAPFIGRSENADDRHGFCDESNHGIYCFFTQGC